MDEQALRIVYDYINSHLDKSDEPVEFEVYTVWKAKALQNWKYLLSSSLPDGMYYELTFNGDKNEWYLDAYKRFENKVISGYDRIGDDLDNEKLENKAGIGASYLGTLTEIMKSNTNAGEGNERTETKRDEAET